MSERYILAIDQGTSSSRALIFDSSMQVAASAQQEFQQHYPRPGWVEHDAEEIWTSVVNVAQKAIDTAAIPAASIASIGITNQRETTVVWNRASGKPVCNAIVWQDRRTAGRCEELVADGHEDYVSATTGLRLDPYFSGTKLAWIRDNVDGARAQAEKGELVFGTIDTFLIWRLTGGTVHATDATNASRTLLFNIHEQAWDEKILAMLGVPASMLPDVRDCAADFGTSDAALFGAEIPVGGVAGDQQAALLGQAGLDKGMTKSTYGTGCFVIANTGATALPSTNKLLTTVASRIGGNVTYGLEGSVFVAGSAIQWLRDSLRIVDAAPDTEGIAQETGIVDDVYVVPAFAGLGAPYWDPHARGAIVGLTRGSGRDEIITATLQSVAFQTRDLVDAMSQDGISPSVIRVDGGMVANDWFLQFLADVLDIPVERPVNVESTVLGAAFLAALQAGLIGEIQEISSVWRSDRVFEPAMDADRRQALLDGWDAAVRRVQ